MRGKRFRNTLLVRCLPSIGPTTTTTTLPPNCAPGQKSLTMTVPLEDPAHPELGNGSDLDNGWTGTSHNFPVIGGSTLFYCLSGCDGTTTFDCQASGATGAGTPNGPTFGAPLPLLAANVPVCVVNQFVDATLTGTYNLQTGEAGSAANPNLVHLTSNVYLRSSFPEVCPRCQGAAVQGIGDTGTCSDTAKNAGASCTVNGEVTVAGKGLYLLSSDCTPLGDQPPDRARHQAAVHHRRRHAARGSPLPRPGQTQDDGCSGGAATPAARARRAWPPTPRELRRRQGRHLAAVLREQHRHAVLPHQGRRQHHADRSSGNERADVAERRHVLHRGDRLDAHQHHHRPAGTGGAAAPLAGVGAAVGPLAVTLPA